jgi:hypothetical protein
MHFAIRRPSPEGQLVLGLVPSLWHSLPCRQCPYVSEHIHNFSRPIYGFEALLAAGSGLTMQMGYAIAALEVAPEIRLRRLAL